MPSAADLIAAGIGAAQAIRDDLKYRPGDVTTAQLYGFVAMADVLMEYATQLLKASRVTTAEGADLDEEVADIGMTRNDATKAQVTLSFSRTSAGIAGTIPANTICTTEAQADGLTLSFKTLTAITVLSGDNGPFEVTAEALTTGPASNVNAGKITKISGTLFDTFTVTNDLAAAGGNAKESDAALRARYFLFFPTLERGTEKALIMGALDVDNVSYAATREIAGGVEVIVADSTGNSNPLMTTQVYTALQAWRVLGPTLYVQGATPYTTDLVASVFVRDGFDFAAVSASIETSLRELINETKPGQSVTIHEIVALILGKYPDDIRRVRFDSIVGNGVAISPDVVEIAPVSPYQKLYAGSLTLQAA